LIKQRTLAGTSIFEGVGLHTGIVSKATVSPAKAGDGIVFVTGGVKIPATYKYVVDTSFATTLGKDDATVRTVEHILSALSGLGIDNALIEIEGPEVPAMDGSAREFVEAFKEAGIVELDAPRGYVKVIKSVTVHDGDKSASILPSPNVEVTYRIDFDHPLLSDQCFSSLLDDSGYSGEIAPTRTFGFLRDVEMLKSNGLALGGSLENAVVLDDGKVLNDGGLRFDDELVRHKVLDAIGDLALAGMPIIGHIVMDKSGHKLNHMLVTELMADPESYVLMDGSYELTEEYAGSSAVVTA